MAPRVTRRRKGASRCSSGGSLSRAAAVAAVAPSSWKLQPRCEASPQLAVGRDSSECSPQQLGQPSCMSTPSSGCPPQQPGLASTVADADGADAVRSASLENPPAALVPSLPEEPLSPEDLMAIALEVLYRLDLASETRQLSDGELDLYDFLLSQVTRLEMEIEEHNKAPSIRLSDDLQLLEDNVIAINAVLSMIEPQAQSLANFSSGYLTFWDEVSASSLQPPEPEARSLANFSSGYLAFWDEVSASCLQPPCMSSPYTSIKLSDDLQLPEEYVIAINAELSLAEPEAHSLASFSSGYSTFWDEVSASSLQPSSMPSPSSALSTPVAVAVVDDANWARADAVVMASSGKPSAAFKSLLQEEPLSPALQMKIASEVLFRLDLTSETRQLSAGELDLYDFLLSQLTRLELEIEEHNSTASSFDSEDPLICQLQAPSAALDGVPSPLVANEVPSPTVLGAYTFDKLSDDLQLPEGKVTEINAELSMPEPEAQSSSSSALSTFVAVAAVAEANRADAAVLLSLFEEDLLSPALQMEIALEVLFRLDVARENRLLSAGELVLSEFLLSQLTRFEVENEEHNATAPSIPLEDPSVYQVHAPSVALGSALSPLPTVVGASTSKLSAGLQLSEGNDVASNAELSTPRPEATPSAHKSSAEPESAVEDDEITEALCGHSGHRRLPVFRGICPE